MDDADAQVMAVMEEWAREDMERIADLRREGHTKDCAEGQVYGYRQPCTCREVTP